MLERTVRLLQACRAITETDSPQAREKLNAMPREIRFPNPRAAADWLRVRRPALLASARLAVADGGLDNLARRLMSQLVRAMVAHEGTQAAAADLYDVHGLVLDVAERQGLAREQAAALLNLGDVDARTGRTREALARYRSALDAGRRAHDPYAIGRAMESVGAAHQELGDHDRAADWFGRALAERLARGEDEQAARLYGRIATAHTHAGRYGEALRNWRAAVMRLPQERRCGLPRAGVERAGPRAGARGAARGGAAHLPRGGGVRAPCRRPGTARGAAAPARRHPRAPRRPHRRPSAPRGGRAHAGRRGSGGRDRPGTGR